jgi:hypothetical protein
MKNTVQLKRLAHISSLTITMFLFAFMAMDVNQSMAQEQGTEPFFVLIVSHLLWPGIALLMTLLAWKNHRLGTWLFTLAGIGYILMAWDRFPFSVYVLITGPFFLTSLFHGLTWRSMHK